jgi:hypothetical protein
MLSYGSLFFGTVVQLNGPINYVAKKYSKSKGSRASPKNSCTSIRTRPHKLDDVRWWTMCMCVLCSVLRDDGRDVDTAPRRIDYGLIAYLREKCKHNVIVPVA